MFPLLRRNKIGPTRRPLPPPRAVIDHDQDKAMKSVAHISSKSIEPAESGPSIEHVCDLPSSTFYC